MMMSIKLIRIWCVLITHTRAIRHRSHILRSPFHLSYVLRGDIDEAEAKVIYSKVILPYPTLLHFMSRTPPKALFQIPLIQVA